MGYIANNKSPEPYELFGVECGGGWKELLKPIFDYIEKYNQDKSDEDKIVVLQCKEKFGQLRFYTNFETEELSQLIEYAECDSWETCEMCGSKEHIGHTSGWIMTVCHDCIKKIVVKNKNNRIWREFKTNIVYKITPTEDEIIRKENEQKL